ncbi:hypothetical protein BGE01nite_02140 [Brevifollis gellanilyticus]|uniref:Flavodoxin-like fold domain-containing protein n=2 Tax=Brevifollis gellanilyticus TaxID=748831 RepID=A0A512M2G0_9BACT|nr:hypothetical protein BGE01nite_02140 [Brevifollis gellanilyticus]
MLTLRDLDFDLNEKGQELEPTLVQAQQHILWAEHLVIIHPVWWATMPALLKGWIDRVMRCGFAFQERDDGEYEGLLQGRSATMISTLDTPLWVYRWILGAPSVRALRDGTLGFCGIRPVKVRLLSILRDSTPEMRRRWLQGARQVGAELDRTLRSGWRPRMRVWLQALRPQFYLFPWMALTAGAVSGSAASGRTFYWRAYLLGWAGAWLVEGMSVITNEIHDAKTDAANRNSGPFTGGSRVLAEGALSECQLRSGRKVAAWGLCIVVLLAVLIPGANLAGVFTLLPVALLLGLGYSAPPLKLAYRTCGEVVVAFTHSVLLVMLGHVSQGGGLALQPWLISAPMFFAILPSITLAGFPDLEADSACGKQTLVARFGRRTAVKFALATTVVAAAMSMILAPHPVWLMIAQCMHGSVLLVALSMFHQNPRAGRIDGLLMIALTYMFWFAWPH